jgi:hypothetical protein
MENLLEQGLPTPGSKPLLGRRHHLHPHHSGLKIPVSL